MPPQLLSQSPGDPPHGGACRGIAHLPVLTHTGRHRCGEIDDLAVVLPDHVVADSSGTVEASLGLHCQGLVPLVLSEIVKRDIFPGPGVVHQDVDLTEFFRRHFEHRLHTVAVRHIDGHGDGVASGFRDPARDAVREAPFNITHDHGGALLGQPHGNGPADSTPRARDNGYSVLQSHMTLQPLPSYETRSRSSFVYRLSRCSGTRFVVRTSVRSLSTRDSGSKPIHV